MSPKLIVSFHCFLVFIDMVSPKCIVSFHCFMVFTDILVKNQMKFDRGDQPRWHFNLAISLGIVYINKKGYFNCPTIGDKQNKL